MRTIATIALATATIIAASAPVFAASGHRAYEQRYYNAQNGEQAYDNLTTGSIQRSYPDTYRALTERPEFSQADRDSVAN